MDCVPVNLKTYYTGIFKFIAICTSVFYKGRAPLSSGLNACLQYERLRQLLFSPYSLKGTKSTSQRKTMCLFQAEMKLKRKIE